MKTSKQYVYSKVSKQRLWNWITERESIRLKKERGVPKPWTRDPILQTYRFCNVRRMDDKVSVWLNDNWYQPYYGHRSMVFAVGLARFINKSESLGLITNFVFDKPKPQWSIIKAELREHRDKGNTIFNGAYMVRGNDGMDKIECVVDWYVKPLEEIETLTTDTMKESWLQILEYYGMGSFMAGQVVADLRHAVSGEWSDRNSWAPIGPGSRRGMNRYLNRSVNSPLAQTEFLEELNKLMIEGCNSLPVFITKRLEAHDWQNCLCEFDKHERIINNEGKPKQLYKGLS